MPLHPALRGPSLALIQDLVCSGRRALSDRHHPGRKELPKLAGNRHAFAQSIWRHILFGAGVLGELERRVNAEPEPAPLSDEVEFVFDQRAREDRARGLRRPRLD